MNENRLFVRSASNRLLLSLPLFEKRKTVTIFLDANRIWVAPECRDAGGHQGEHISTQLVRHLATTGPKRRYPYTVPH
jgi:hypothetical protein